MNTRPLLSIVTPCYNEEANVEEHHRRVLAAIVSLEERYDFEFLYTDNHSSDATFARLEELHARDPRVRVARFSSNVGYNRAVFLGLTLARGDAAIVVQADLQDPPELIPQFVAGWEKGHDVVYGRITDRDEGMVLKSLRRIFYWMVNALAESPIPRDAGDFRLLSRRALEALKQSREDDPYVRGIVARIGYPQLGVPYKRDARQRGRSDFGFLRLVAYAVNSLVSTGVTPIRMVSLLGLCFALLGFAATATVVAWKIFWGETAPEGFATLATLITFFGGVQLLAIGVIGEYLRKTYQQTLERPLGFVEKGLNVPEGNATPPRER